MASNATSRVAIVTAWGRGGQGQVISARVVCEPCARVAEKRSRSVPRVQNYPRIEIRRAEMRGNEGNENKRGKKGRKRKKGIGKTVGVDRNEGAR